MMNQFKNVLNWKQKAKLFGFMKNVHIKNNSVILAYTETSPIRDCEIARIRVKLEKTKASAFQFIRTAV